MQLQVHNDLYYIRAWQYQQMCTLKAWRVYNLQSHLQDGHSACQVGHVAVHPHELVLHVHIRLDARPCSRRDAHVFTRLWVMHVSESN